MAYAEPLYFLATVDGRKLHIVVGPTGRKAFCGERVAAPPTGGHTLRTMDMQRACLKCIKSAIAAIGRETDPDAKRDLQQLLGDEPTKEA